MEAQYAISIALATTLLHAKEEFRLDDLEDLEIRGEFSSRF